MKIREAKVGLNMRQVAKDIGKDPFASQALRWIYAKMIAARPWWWWALPFSYIRMLQENMAIMATQIMKMQVDNVLEDIANEQVEEATSGADIGEETKSKGSSVH